MYLCPRQAVPEFREYSHPISYSSELWCEVTKRVIRFGTQVQNSDFFRAGCGDVAIFVWHEGCRTARNNVLEVWIWCEVEGLEQGPADFSEEEHCADKEDVAT